MRDVRSLLTGAAPVVRRAWPWVAIVVIKLWLVDGQALSANSALTIDDRWFAQRAAAIRAGDWLGPFDAHTLIKQPGYPMFIALTNALGIPLLLAQHLLYIAAAGLVVRALGPVLATRLRRLSVFAVLVFNPMTMNAPVAARIDRAGIYPALTIFLIACLIGLALRPAGGGFAAWAAGASASVTALWLVREEWFLVLPAVAVGLGLAVVRTARSDRPLTKRLVSTAIVAGLMAPLAIGQAVLRRANHDRYGLSVTNIEQTSIATGMGAMLRVSPVTIFEQFPLTLETRAALYAASQSLAELRREIEGRPGQHFASTRPDGRADLSGAVVPWVLLDALAATGKAGTAEELDGAWRTIATEINEACNLDRLNCGPPHTGITPAWTWNRTDDLLRRSITGLRRTLDLQAFSALSTPADVDAADRELFTTITREPLADAGRQDASERLRVHAISVLRRIYRLAVLVTAAVALRKTWAAIRDRRWPSSAVVVPITIAGLVVVARTVGLAYVDLTAFPGFTPVYTASGYAAALVVGAVVLFGTTRHSKLAPQFLVNSRNRTGASGAHSPGSYRA